MVTVSCGVAGPMTDLWYLFASPLAPIAAGVLTLPAWLVVLWLRRRRRIVEVRPVGPPRSYRRL